MIVLDLPQETIQVIKEVAQKSGQSVQDFITISAYEKALQSFAQSKQEQNSEIKTDMLLTDFIKQFPKSQLTDSGLMIKKELRDEWD